MIALLHNETNYTYFGARYYDSDLNSWLSVDPLAAARPNLSPYNYCQNNPVVRVDPTGMLDGDTQDWFQNKKTGEIIYQKDYRKEDAFLLGDDFSWLGENGMFNQSPEQLYNSFMNVEHFIGEYVSFGFSAKDSKQFMKEQGYNFKPLIADYYTQEITQVISEPHTPVYISNKTEELKSIREWIYVHDSQNGKYYDIIECKRQQNSSPLFYVYESWETRKFDYSKKQPLEFGPLGKFSLEIIKNSPIIFRK